MHHLDGHELNGDWTLPAAYGEDRMVLMPRDPHWLFSYWEVTPQQVEKLRAQHPGIAAGKTVLRVYNVEHGAHHDIEINVPADKWHFPVTEADCAYRAELGCLLPDNQFIAMVSSNTVRTPRETISSVIDPRWKMFAFWRYRFYRRMMFGLSSYELFDEETNNIKGGTL